MSAAGHYAEKALELKERIRDLEQRLAVSETEVARMTKLSCDLLDGDYKEQAIKALLRTGSTGALTAASERARVATEALAFAASCIKSGEPWSDTCEHVIGTALAASPETPAAPGAQGFQGGPVNITQQASQETADAIPALNPSALGAQEGEPQPDDERPFVMSPWCSQCGPETYRAAGSALCHDCYEHALPTPPGSE